MWQLSTIHSSHRPLVLSVFPVCCIPTYIYKEWKKTGAKWYIAEDSLGHSNMIHCFPFPARIVLSHRMLSFIIWSSDQNFHYCDPADWARGADYSKWRSWTYLLHVCQPSGLSFHGILLAQANRSTPLVTFSTNPYCRVFPARLNCLTIWCMLPWAL